MADNTLTEHARQIVAPRTEHAELIRVLQSSLYPGAKAESIELVLSYCRANGLDPMLKPVHIVPQSLKINGQWVTKDTLMPGIADYRIKASRTGEYVGKSEPEFGQDVTEELGGVTVTYPKWCKIVVRRWVKDAVRDFPATEMWLENYAVAGRDSEAPNKMWKKRAYGQLAKCAEAQALRMAFPEFSGGSYTAEEMEGKAGYGFAGETIEAAAEPAPAMQHPSVAAAAPRRSVSELLAEIEPLLAAAQRVVGIEAIEARDDVAAVMSKGSDKQRKAVHDLIAGARLRIAESSTGVLARAADDDALDAADDDFPGDIHVPGEDRVGA
jgi:phage recombination protein Bet